MRFLPRLFGKAIRKGRLTLKGTNGYERSFGDGDGPTATIRITDPALDWKIFLNPELNAAEAFMDGGLVVEDGGAWDLLSVFFVNKRSFDMSPTQIFWNGVARKLRRVMQHNPIAQSRKNVGHHYDLGNAFYRMWLDWDMQYSCGYFPQGGETLEDAQTLKKRHICAKLGLEPGQKVLDIGCGWGGMGLYLAAVAKVEVVGVTLSTEQLAIAQARAEAAGLTDRCRFELKDYRHVTETFDRVVSVGMLEHVGVGHLGEYFLKVRDFLKPEGVALIHSNLDQGAAGDHRAVFAQVHLSGRLCTIDVGADAGGGALRALDDRCRGLARALRGDAEDLARPVRGSARRGRGDV